MIHSDLKATNTASNPKNVVPSTTGTTNIDGITAIATLKPYSWNVIRFAL